METREKIDADMVQPGEDCISVVPKVKGEQVGFAAADKTPDYVEIKHFIVYRDGKGIGVSMLSAIEDWARQNQRGLIQMHFTEETKGKPMPADKIGLKIF